MPWVPIVSGAAGSGSADRPRTRPRVSARTRRHVVQGLRAVARRSGEVGWRRRRELLLHDRAASVRTDLLQIAVLLETARDPDPACVAELRQLLTDGCTSPLLNRDVHASELRATLYYARRRLT
jgi:hypothetical protein